MATPLQGTESAANAIARVSYTHDAMIDLVIACPGSSQGEIAKHFGFTQAWVSRVINSDAFQARLAERKTEIVDPTLTATLEERLKALASRSVDVVMGKLENSMDGNFALKALEVTSKSLGFGAREKNLAVQNNFVVALPQKHGSSAEWVSAHTGRTLDADA